MKASTLEEYQARILRVLLYIQANLNEAISLEELARIACFSPFHFHRVFRGMLGEGVHEHIRRIRLERAASQLIATQRSVIRVALDAGFESPESFTRAFKLMFHRPPSLFRRAHRWVQDPSPSGVHFVPGGELEGFQPHSSLGDPMSAEIRTQAAKTFAFVRHIGPYQQVGAAWESLCAWAGPQGLLGPHAHMFGLSHDDPEVTPADKLRYDACIELKEERSVSGAIGIQELPAGEYAVTLHRGPLEKLAASYARLCGEWIPKSGREIRSAPALEIYRKDPGQCPPEEMEVEIWMPLA